VLTAAVLVAGCGHDCHTAAPATVAASFDCLLALDATGVTSASPAEEARAHLQALIDSRPPPAERAYYAALLATLIGVPDAATVGTRLDDVPCDL